MWVNFLKDLYNFVMEGGPAPKQMRLKILLNLVDCLWATLLNIIFVLLGFSWKARNNIEKL